MLVAGATGGRQVDVTSREPGLAGLLTVNQGDRERVQVLDRQADPPPVPVGRDFDLALMAPAMAFLAMGGLQRGFLPYEKTLLAFVWFAPLLTRALAENLYVPLGLAALIVLFGLAIRRSAHDLAAARR